MAARAVDMGEEEKRLIPTDGSVTIRMYRIGHGDCFLLAFPSREKDRPVYVLIDCGYKPGSPGKIKPPTKPADIAQSIIEATGGFVDVAIITHEHQDHVNAITKKNFADLKLGTVWFAWTEDPDDELAKQLRKEHKSALLELTALRRGLKGVGEDEKVKAMDRFLAFEFGFDVDDDPDNDGSGKDPMAEALAAAAKNPENSANKIAMKLFKDKTPDKLSFLKPHDEVIELPGADDVRVYALGPSRDRARNFLDTDPQGDEEFKFGMSNSDSLLGYLANAVTSEQADVPFGARYRLPLNEVAQHPDFGEFFKVHYGEEASRGAPEATGNDNANKTKITKETRKNEVASNASWRRINKEWLNVAMQLMIKANNATNNTSLVLAFELGKGGKVLLFAADAQRSNWLSWADGTWVDGKKKIEAKDLLKRTVLYKVGHHGSHNATLNGTENSAYPSLGWMGLGKYAREFTAMITAVRAWAKTQDGWDHPMPAIKTALLNKASGRVFQTDTGIDEMKMPEDGSQADWTAFLHRSRGTDLYFDYTVKF